MAFWLMKCEPSAYSIADLARDRVTGWEGVRNYQARNFLRDRFAVGDLAVFYHSNADPSGAAGLMHIKKPGYPDPFALNPHHRYYDPRQTLEKPVWYTVDVEFIATFPNFVPLATIKGDPRLKGILVAQPGSRLSIQPLSEAHFDVICELGGLPRGTFSFPSAAKKRRFNQL